MQLRETSQRRLVRELLTDNYTHPTAEEVYLNAREKNPGISRGTVYRNLNLLADMGELLRIKTSSGPDHYDATTDKHYHFVCRGCNRVMDVPLSYNAELDGIAPDIPGCKTEYHRLVFVGLCPECNKAQEGALQINN